MRGEAGMMPEIEFPGVFIEEAAAAEVKRKWHALLDAMAAMPKPGHIEKREPIIFRDD